MTSEGENDLIPLVNYAIRTATTEQKFMMYKTDNMASQRNHIFNVGVT